MYYSADSGFLNPSKLLSEGDANNLVPPLLSNSYIYGASADSVATEAETRFNVSLDDTATKGTVDSKGMLLKFARLYEFNSDIRGWLHIDGTGVDYPVLQATGGTNFYLTHNFEGNKDKNGSLYIDGNTHLSAKNLVIHGHNMKSTGMMFHELEKYNSVSYYLEHPYFTFDSLYEESKWAIISVMKVPGDFSSAGSFNYIKSNFNSSDEYLNFLYEVKMRSIYNIPVTVNEYDSLVMLSTCSYELDNYRTVIVARKLRKKEKISKISAQTKLLTINNSPLYSDDWYRKYGGKAPVKTTFMDAFSFGEINWYDGTVEPITPLNNYVMAECEINNISESSDNQTNTGKTQSDKTKNTDKKKSDSSKKSNSSDKSLETIKAYLLYKIKSKDSVSFAGVLTSDKSVEVLSLMNTKDNFNTYTDSKLNVKKIKELIIPDFISVGNREFKVSGIEDDAFFPLTGLTSVKTGNNTVAIPDKAFTNCSKLTDVVIGKSTEVIGKKAFFGLNKIEKIKIKSDKIKKIGEKAFPDKKKSKYKIK
jgi:sortase B